MTIVLSRRKKSRGFPGIQRLAEIGVEGMKIPTSISCPFQKNIYKEVKKCPWPFTLSLSLILLSSISRGNRGQIKRELSLLVECKE
jgi:hypothetical protein